MPSEKGWVKKSTYPRVVEQPEQMKASFVSLPLPLPAMVLQATWKSRAVGKGIRKSACCSASNRVIYSLPFHRYCTFSSLPLPRWINILTLYFIVVSIFEAIERAAQGSFSSSCWTSNLAQMEGILHVLVAATWGVSVSAPTSKLRWRLPRRT